MWQAALTLPSRSRCRTANTKESTTANHPPPPLPPRQIKKAFPEVLGLSLDALTANVAKLQRDWKLEGQVLARAVARQPAVLGYTIDCMGDCAGECNRCWARF